MDKSFYFDQLYPFQDDVLRLIEDTSTGFYLTGGTALSRGYLQHRFSDDLDLFVNDESAFSVWANEVVQALQRDVRYIVKVLQLEERFVRLTLFENDVTLRIEMVNDVPAHIGQIVSHAVLGRLDSAENILANKVTAAIDRNEPKDLADIWGLCCKMSLPLKPGIENASSKAAGIFPADLARVLCSVTKEHWQVVKWIDPPPVDRFLDELRGLGEGLIL
jgi:hypothetical protein